ncbi:MAG: class I SAM-dependent methyltransferase [Chitinophagaceae bacterium]
MSLAQHTDAQLRFDQQVNNSRNFVLPFIEKVFPVLPPMRVMEIGCGEGGVLYPFLEKGCEAVGIDLEESRIRLAENFLHEFVCGKKVRLIARNIYDLDFLGEFSHYFDLILLKDAIEHIPDQERLIGYLGNLLSPGGQIFFGFPPWYMPLGGHQQICKNRILSLFPYIHLLPTRLYRRLLLSAGEDQDTILELLEIKSTGISIERFEKILRRQHYQITRHQHYLFNPIYQYKFGLKPRKQLGIIVAIPYLRNFFTTCVYYLVGRDPAPKIMGQGKKKTDDSIN